MSDLLDSILKEVPAKQEPAVAPVKAPEQPAPEPPVEGGKNANDYSKAFEETYGARKK